MLITFNSDDEWCAETDPLTQNVPALFVLSPQSEWTQQRPSVDCSKESGEKHG